MNTLQTNHPKFNLEVKPYPQGRCYCLLGPDPKTAIKTLVEKGQPIEIFVDREGARSAYTQIQCGDYVITVDDAVEGFKTKETVKTNMFSGRTTTRYYFKILKSQGLEEYKKYLQHILANVEEILGVKFTQETIFVFNKAFN